MNFKVGDEVRCVDGLEEDDSRHNPAVIFGDVYTIKEIDDYCDNYYVSVVDAKTNQVSSGWAVERFVLVNKIILPEDLFVL